MKINKAIAAMDKSGSFRIYMAVTSQMVQDAHDTHHTSPIATHALGRALTGAAIMGLMMREPGFKLTLQFKGDGPAQQIICTAGSDGFVKGYIVNPLIDIPAKADGSPNVSAALGKGVLTCIRDTGLKEPYIGKIDLVSGEIADDLTRYFFESEQQPSSVSLGIILDENADVSAAGGFIIQVLPDAKDEAITALENCLASMPPVSELCKQAQDNAVDKDIDTVMKDLLASAFGDMPEEYAIKPLEILDTGWRCDCSTERLEQVVISLGSKEIRNIINEDGQAEITCQFCGKHYKFDKEHLQTLLNEAIRNRINIIPDMNGSQN